MTNPSEKGNPRGREILTFPYKDTHVAVPVVSSLTELQRMARSRVIPGLIQAQVNAPQGAEVGIALVPYFYATDEFDFQHPEAINALLQFFRKAGIEPNAELKKLDPIKPKRYNILTNTHPDDYWQLDSFPERTFLIGPLTALPLPSDVAFVDSQGENKLTTLHANATVAIHGKTILADISLSEEKERIFHRELLEYLDHAFDLFK